MKIVSLFSGAGGLDLGFKMAGHTIIWANDLYTDAVETYKYNLGNHIYCRDIFSVNENEVPDCDIIIGGFPCQGFSVAGKMDPDDERSKLIWSFLDVVDMVKPRMFIMENVKALGKLEKWKEIRKAFVERAQQKGYFCQFTVLNASEFGVSQNRERVFFVGSNQPYDIFKLSLCLEDEKKKPQTLRELLGNLPPAGSDENPLTCTAKITLAAFPVMRKSPYAGMIFNGMGRPLNLDAVSSTLPASMGGNKTPIIDCRVLDDPDHPDWVKEYHKGLMDGRIEPDFTLAPDHLRRITILESAIIQSFPPSYQFKGTKSAVYTQIGNAVPCKLAESIARAAISVCLQENAS